MSDIPAGLYFVSWELFLKFEKLSFEMSHDQESIALLSRL